ncbi:MAG: arginine--tRNA ligase [bacterium]|nr:arginine--tRNA ligase [Acidimicrobiia bacterium]MCY4649233.1 arginine--tRNA ligase [bacterium]
MSLISHLGEVFGSAFQELGLDSEYGKVFPSQRPELGDFQCNGALAAARSARQPPSRLATTVAEMTGTDSRFQSVTAAGPGFVNIKLSDGFLAEWVEDMASDSHLGAPRVSRPLHIVVDYGGPNVAKPMHVGHLRSTIIGDALARIFARVGHRVTRDPHFGDWGTQMGMLIIGVRERFPQLAYFDCNARTFPARSPVSLADLAEMYPQVAAECAASPQLAEQARRATLELQEGRPGYRALWKQMVQVSLESQRADFARLGVEFDLWYGESTVADRVEGMIARMEESGLVTESEGATVVEVAMADDKAPLPPLMLCKSDGAALYATTDLATIEMRVDDLGADSILYVVDARQADHFRGVFRAARLTGLVPPAVGLEHIGFGTMNGPDGRPFRTREGGVVRLGDLIDQVTEAARRRLEENDMAKAYPESERRAVAEAVGLAALKFGDLSTHRASNYVFDPDRFVSFSGKTGPYLQYGVVRIRSLLARAARQGLAPGRLGPPAHPAERRLMLALTLMPEAINRAASERAPHHLAEYCYRVAVGFTRFYDQCHILSEPDPGRRDAWLGLADITGRVLSMLLDILGIDVPDRM